MWILLLSGSLAKEVEKGPSEDTQIILDTHNGQFTVDGKPTYLYGISYYGALGASPETIQRDLAEIDRFRFNWVRVWATWAAFGTDVSAVDAEGLPRPIYLGRLQWFVAECERRGLFVDVTIGRGNGVTGPPKLQTAESHRRAVETLVKSLRAHRNWYLDLSNERNVNDQRFTSFPELRELRVLVRALDPKRLVAASHAGDIDDADLREYLFTANVDLLCPHRPRASHTPLATKERTIAYLAAMKRLGRVVPLHYQEPLRRDWGTWQPRAEDFVMDFQGARAGGSAGWCFHNGNRVTDPEGQPRRSFDLQTRSLFDQLDGEEIRALRLLDDRMHGKSETSSAR